ncbi:OPT oligopeptide transporter [Phyllosticta citriasiana]|uniref:OPT oligopeptide transporter n=1 Tax=Phyllosticta citriasiana TaxID=595635 RepID=A0ABR1KEN8_9PEZI
MAAREAAAIIAGAEANTNAVDDNEAIKTVDATVSAIDSEKDVEKHVDNMKHGYDDDVHSDSSIIVTGADAARRLLPLRDDFDPAVTFRSLFLATILCCFQAVMFQIYRFKPTSVDISGTFIVLIAYFLGKAWASVFPRGDHLEARWRAQGGQGKAPFWLRGLIFFNPGPWGLKEHAICAITATSASEAAASSEVFAAQMLFYDLPVRAIAVILATISIGLFGYGLAGLIRPVAVWHVEAVFWGSLPTVKTLQGLHWDTLKNSKPLRYFWYAFGSMFAYEWLPAYVWPWLNSVSIPCLASMKVTGQTGERLTQVFGGASNNEGLGLFSLSFDWQYITSFATALPLKLQVHRAVGYVICFAAMAGIYWGNVWGSLDLPFMSTSLRMDNGSAYPTTDVFIGGVLDKNALSKHGIPRLAGTFAYSMMMANAAIGALIAHCILFWGRDIVTQYKRARQGNYDDPHHDHMAKHYKEVKWTWYAAVLVISFILGLVVVLKENITLSAGGFILSLVLGIIIAPFSTLLYSRFGTGIATNNLSKMMAGLILPGRPVGNMYFAAWSHNVISSCVDLCNDLKIGEYLKIPPRVMFLAQIYGTILGGFVNYAVMDSIVTGNKDLLAKGNGDASWSGATVQSYNTNAASWALADHLYKVGARYAAVSSGLGIGAALVVVHRLVVYLVPRDRVASKGWWLLRELNVPHLINFSGYIPYNASQTCVLLSQVTAGFTVQYYLRNYKPRIFSDYSYLVTGAWDGAALFVLFLLSFAVLGAGGSSRPMASWWGNNLNGNYDLCPDV